MTGSSIIRYFEQALRQRLQQKNLCTLPTVQQHCAGMSELTCSQHTIIVMGELLSFSSYSLRSLWNH